MAKKKNLLDVEASQKCLDEFKEETAQEFGFFHSVQEMDAMAKDMTKRAREKREQNENDC